MYQKVPALCAETRRPHRPSIGATRLAGTLTGLAALRRLR